MSDHEDPLGPSDPETQFVPHEDDEETLWEVIEITAEKGKVYKVRWKGIDPTTQKPWPQSWVHKHDCTDDLVRDWKLRQGNKKKKVSKRDSEFSRKSSGPSKATASAKSTRRSTSTAVTQGLGSVNTPTASSASAKTGAKRRRVESIITTTPRITVVKANLAGGAEGDARPNSISGSVPPPRKRRKLEVELVNNPASGAEVDEKGRKRKISSRVITTDDDIDDYVEMVSEDEIVELDSEHSKLQHQNLSQPAEEQEEADDRIVEESISEFHYSPPPSSQQEPIHNQEEEDTPTPSVRAQGQAHSQQDTAEKSIPTVSRPQPEIVDSFPILAKITSKLDPLITRSPSSSSAATDGRTPGKSDQATRSRAESAAGSGSHSLTERSTKPISTFPILAKITSKLDPLSKRSTPSPSSSSAAPPGKSDQASRSRAESAAGSGSHSLTERGTKPISITPPIPRSKGVGSSGPSTGILIPTLPRNTDRGANGEEDGNRSPILSHGTEERLERFDREMAITGSTEPLFLPDESDSTPPGNNANGEEDGNRFILSPGARERLEQFDREMAVTGSAEPLFLPDESDSTDSHARLKPKVDVKNQNSKSGSKEKGEEQLDKRLSSHHLSDSEAESGVESDADAHARTLSKNMRPHKPLSRSRSRLADTEEAEEDNSSSTGAGSANTKLTDRKAFNAPSKTISKTTFKPQSTNTFQASPSPSTTTVRRSANPRSNSFVRDIIPETEESRSQSQEADMQVSIVSHLLVPPTTPPPVNMKFLKFYMTPQPKSRLLSRAFSADEVFVQLGIDMDVGNDVDENLNGELDGVDEAIKNTSNKKANLAMTMTMESSGPLPRISSTPKSRSRSGSVSSQKSKSEKEPVPAEDETPLTVSIHRESLQASQPVDFQTGSAENSPHLGAAMNLLNTKSEEISKLENQLSAEQRKNEDLLEQLSALRRHMTESTNNTSSATKTLEQELAEARAQLALQTASWENERATLTLNIETAIRGKVSAEQDRDFFREQYSKASGFVSSVRDENAELEKEIKIATDQARSGVSSIKTTFELRTKSLEEDVRAWRRMAEFLIEKDHRTNDDIRRRAAEEPELRARCDRQESALEDFSGRLLQLEKDLDEKKRLFVETEEARKRWQETTVKLNLDLNEAKTKLEKIGKFGIDESAHPPNSHEFIYRCYWRPDDSNVACEADFLNISELQEHLYTGRHHLQLD